MAVWSVTNVAEITKNHRIDSEYFQPFYLEAEEKVLSVESKKLGQIGDFLIGPFGSAFHVSNYDPDSNYRYIRGKDVKPFTLLDADSVFMPEKDFKRLEKYAVIPEDLLISVVGTLGNVAIVPETVKGIFSCKSTVFRNSKVDPCYLLAYFNSSYGRNCLLRRQRGAIQAGLNKDDLKTVPVPIFDDEKEIGALVRESLVKREESKLLYNQAQQLLEDELGLNNLVLEKPKSYESSFSEIIATNRIDADYYQMYFRQQQSHLNGIQTKPLRQIVNFTKGIEVGTSSYTDEGNLFIRVSNVKENGVVTTNSDKYIGQKTYDKLMGYNPNIGDLLLTKDGTLGVCLVVDELVEGIISGGIMKMTIKDVTIPAEYLSLVINSSICKFQAEQACSGALILHWKPKDIAALKVPILSDDTMQKLSNMVIEAKKARKESEQLLEQAKRRVEELIEGGTES